MNMFSYYITTHFIPSNKYYNSCYNSHSMYQTDPYFLNFKRLREVEIVLELSDQWTHRCKRKHPTLQPEAYSQIKGKQ